MAIQHLAGCTVGGRTQAQGLSLALATQIQVTVLQASLFAYLTGGGRVIDLERERCRLVEHLELGDVDFNFTRGKVRVRGAFRARLNHACDLHAVLRAQVVSAFGHLGFTEDNLSNAGAVTQVDEDNTAMVAATGHPTSQRDGLPRHLLAQFAC